MSSDTLTMLACMISPLIGYYIGGAIERLVRPFLRRRRENRENRRWRRTVEIYDHINSHQDRRP